ncbi:MAG: hypothetical protein NC907_01605 [Candidatus Omnitrophica bacterium]|nr:hypothetical protein [Candidatus Omnitrophota bacterium]
MKKVLHFGAGNIGRGFFGQLYCQSGYHVIFVDIDESIIKMLNGRKEYPLWLTGKEIEKLTIKNVSGINFTDRQAILKASKDINLLSFSVGVNNVGNLIQVLKEIIENKAISNPSSQLNIIIGENIKDASKTLKQHIIKNLSPSAVEYFEKNVGLVETVLGRMIPIVPEQLKKQYPLIVLAEPYYTMPVAKNMFKGELPQVKGFLFVDDIETYEAMKLYIHNFTHAAFAYAGHKKGYTFIWQTVADRKIKDLVHKAHIEVKQAINKKYNITLKEIDDYYNDLLARFSNKNLADTVIRVAREPIRKIGPNDRIIGAAKLCQNQNILPEYISFFAALCIYYDEPSDPESRKLKNLLETRGLDYVLENISGLSRQDSLYGLIKEKCLNFWKIKEKML